MSKLYLVGWADGMRLAFSRAFDETGFGPVSMRYRTPNSAMDKTGIDRTPFSSFTVELEPSAVIETNVLGPEKPSLSYDVTKVNAYTSRGAALAVNAGGQLGIETDPNGRPNGIYGMWIFPYRDGFCLTDPFWHVPSDIELTYYSLDGDSVYAELVYNNYVGMTVQEAFNAILAGTITSSARFTNRHRVYPDIISGITFTAPSIGPGFVSRLFTDLSSKVDVDLGAESAELIQQFKITDVNIPAFCVELPEFGKSTLEILKSLKKGFGSRSVKDAISNFGKANLAYQYGDRLSVYDGQSIISAISEVAKIGGIFEPRTAKSCTSKTVAVDGASITYCHRFTATASPRGSLERAMYSIAQFANYQNVWDLIPFSFVVDWFVNIDELLRAQDSMVLDSVLTYDRILESSFMEAALDSYEFEGIRLSGTVRQYGRHSISKMPTPDAKLIASVPKPVQWLNGGSLLSQIKFNLR